MVKNRQKTIVWVLLSGFILSILLFLIGLYIDNQNIQKAFEHRSRQALLRIEKRFVSNLNILTILGNRQDRTRLDRFVFQANAAVLAQLRPEILLQAWMPGVKPENIQGFLETARLITQQDYKIKTGSSTSSFPKYYPILHGYPQVKAQVLLGACPLTYKDPLPPPGPEFEKALQILLPCRTELGTVSNPDSLILAFMDFEKLLQAAVNPNLARGLNFSISLTNRLPGTSQNTLASSSPSSRHKSDWLCTLEKNGPAGRVTFTCQSSPTLYAWMNSYIHWNLFFVGIILSLTLALVIHFLPLPPGVKSRQTLNKEIIARKKIEAALKNSTERLNLALRTFEEGIWDLNLEKGQAFFSDHFFSILGYTAEDFLSQPENLINLVHPMDRDLVKKAWDRLRNPFGKEEEIEIKVKERKGNWTWIWLKASVQERSSTDKRPLRIVGAATKIEKRKYAEQALFETNLIFKQMYQFTPIGMFFLDLKSQIISANPAACSMLKYEEEELINTCLPDYLHSRSDLDMESDKEDLLKGKVSSIKKEAVFSTKLKTKVWVERTVTLIRDEDNNPHYFVVVLTDITQKKQAEEKKVLMDIHMRQVQKMEAMGTLAGGVAHDLNNILTPILIHTETALIEAGVEPKLKSRLEEIRGASLRARDLAAQILNFNRPKDKKLGTLRLNILIKEIMKLLRSALPSNIDIVQNLTAANSSVQADATEMHQIVMNLCTNAAHAMSPKGGVLKVTLEEAQIPAKRFSADDKNHPGPYLLLKIADTGKGIDEDIREKIFEPYFTTKKPGEGTGLGLAVVRGIIKSYKGIIELESEPGKGTCFNIYLPIVKEEAKQTSTKCPVRINSQKALLNIVDDDRPSLMAMSSLLSAMGYRTEIFTNPEEALFSLANKQKKPDLILTDYSMPHMNGVELISKIRKLKPDLPAVIITGQRDQVIIDKEQGKNVKIMQKPVTRQEITNILNELLSSTS